MLLSSSQIVKLSYAVASAHADAMRWNEDIEITIYLTIRVVLNNYILSFYERMNAWADTDDVCAVLAWHDKNDFPFITAENVIYEKWH